MSKYLDLGFEDTMLQIIWKHCFQKDLNSIESIVLEKTVLNNIQAKALSSKLLQSYNTPLVNKILDLKLIIENKLSEEGFDLLGA